MPADPFFRMVVKDVFSIAKRGTIVTGTVESGSLRTGDEVVIRSAGRDWKTVVTGIEAFRKLLDQANQGDAVGLLLKDVAKSDVQPGDEIFTPGEDFSWKP